jgi:ribosomal protein S18 acetylase RimI-like enzyme
MDISIQRATPDRVDSFWQTIDTVARERRYLLFLHAPPIESTRRFVGQIIEKGWSQFYAIHDGRVVGWCDILRNEREGTRHSGHLGMGILPDYRGNGIGTRLISETIADAISKGITRIDLEVFASNTRAIALYRKMGFIEEGRKRRARFLDGEYDDNVVMALVSLDTEPCQISAAAAGRS